MATMQTRVINMLTKPLDEWRVIAVERASVEGLLRNYAAPLAAIGPICQLLRESLVGIAGFRPPIVRGVTTAVVVWLVALAGAVVAALVIEKLAPTFRSSGTLTQALKMVVYAYTPIWVAGVLYLVPGLGAVVAIVASLYAIYLFYLGLPPVLATPSDRVVPYMVVAAIVIILVNFILASIVGVFAGVGAYTMFRGF
jgi:Yip1-like protein